MLQQPPKVIITVAAIFIAIISGLAYLIFSFRPVTNRSSIEGTLEETQQVQPAISDSSYCGDKKPEEVAGCCSDWASKQTNITVPASCTVLWNLNNDRDCVYTCQSVDVAP